MDFNTAHDIIHRDAGTSEYCGSCNKTLDEAGVQKAAGLILKRKTSSGMGYYGDDKEKKQITKTANDIGDLGKVNIHKKQVFAFSEIKASDDGKLPDQIQIMPIGEWDTVPYGKLIISSDDLTQMVENFHKGVRAGVPIDVDHDGKAAAGWINDLSVKADGLYADVEWTPLGTKLLGEKQYRFFSPEFNPEYVDPENKHLQMDNVLIAGSIVNRPLFKELQPLVMSENQNNPLTTKETLSMLFIEPMNPAEIFKKKEKGEALTASEKDFLKNYLFGDSKNDADGDEEEGKKKGKADSEGDTFKKGDKKTASEDNLSGKTAISASELITLREDAAAGRKAAEELETRKVQEQVSAWTFSESNKKGGHFPQGQTNDLVSFVRSLNPDQRKSFGEIVDKMPDNQLLFKEMGGSEVMTAGQKQDKITLAAKELMEKTKSDGKYTMTFREAVTQVSKEEVFASEQAAYDYRKSDSVRGTAN